MGWCHEFGSQIAEGCDHPMTAGSSSCHCEQCGIVCEGKFAGCASVWAAGPREVTLVRPAAGEDLRPSRPNRLSRREGFPRRAAADVATAEPVDAVATSAGPPATAAAADDVLAWLRSAFEGVRSELRVLSDTVERQQRALAVVAESDQAAERLVQLADGLPDRIGGAVAEALRADHELTVARMEELVDELRTAGPAPRNGATNGHAAAGLDETPGGGQLDAVTDELRRSLAEVHSSAAELRNEMVRLAAFRQALADDLPTVASAVDAASKRADGRLAELTERVNDLARRPEWEKALESLQSRRGPSPATP